MNNKITTIEQKLTLCRFLFEVEMTGAKLRHFLAEMEISQKIYDDLYYAEYGDDIGAIEMKFSNWDAFLHYFETYYFNEIFLKEP